MGDIWALAVIIIEFITGEKLFPLLNTKDEKQFILNSIITCSNINRSSREYWSDYTKDVTREGSIDVGKVIRLKTDRHIRVRDRIMMILKKMLVFDPTKRPTATELLSFMEISPISPTPTPMVYPDERLFDEDIYKRMYELGVNSDHNCESFMISLEILTRYLGLIQIPLPFLDVEYLYVASLLIGGYIMKRVSDTGDYIDELNSIISEETPGKSVLSYQEVHFAQIRIIRALNYQIFNPTLHQVFDRFEDRDQNDLWDFFTNVHFSEFLKPVADWLSKLQLPDKTTKRSIVSFVVTSSIKSANSSNDQTQQV